MLSLPCTAYDRILLCLFLVFLTLFWAFLSFQIHPKNTNAFNGNEWSPVFGSFRLDVCKDAGKDGDSMTKVFVERVNFTNAYNEDAAVEVATRNIVDTINDLPTTTFVAMDNKDGKLPTVNGDEYSNYTYTGTMSDVVAVTGLDNQTYYYVAYTITQNTAVVTFTA